MRTLEGSNRVRNGLMGIIILVLVIGVGRASPACRCCSRSRPTTRSSPTPAASTRATRCASPAWTSARSDRMEIEGDKVEDRLHARRHPDRHREPGGHPHRHDPGPQEHRDRAARHRRVASQRRSAARADHHAVPDLRRVLRRDEGGVRLGHRDGEAVAERAVGDDRSDLPAPERRPRRCRAVLRHHRQARRADQATAGQRQQDRRRPRQPQRADQRAAGQRADPARRDQRTQLRGQHAAGAGGAVLGAGRGLHQRQPQPQPCARTAAHHQRHPRASASST